VALASEELCSRKSSNGYNHCVMFQFCSDVDVLDTNDEALCSSCHGSVFPSHLLWGVLRKVMEFSKTIFQA